MILMKEHVIQLPHVHHFAALLAAVEVLLLSLVWLTKISDVHLP
jgi:hypothetical protein